MSSFGDYIRFKNSVAIAGPLFHGCSCSGSGGGAAPVPSYWTEGPTGTISYSGNVGIGQNTTIGGGAEIAQNVAIGGKLDVSQNLVVGGNIFVDLSRNDASGASGGENLVYYNPATNQFRYDPNSLIPAYFYSGIGTFSLTTNFGASFIPAPVFSWFYNSRQYSDILITLNATIRVNSDVSGIHVGVAIRNETRQTTINPFRYFDGDCFVPTSGLFTNSAFPGQHMYSIQLTDIFTNLSSQVSFGDQVRVLGFIAAKNGTGSIQGGKCTWTLQPTI
jgi:hypothetical protein